MVFDEGDDPTETAVDETVLDDAGLSEDALDSLDRAPTDDLLVSEVLPDVPTGSDWWPRRLSPRARTRDGHDARAFSNVSPPRRPVRSRGPAHRPPDPRRLTRRGAVRPRQITRAFPPRSPPRGRIGRRTCFSSFPRSRVGMPSRTLRVLRRSAGPGSKTTRSVEDGILTEDRRNEDQPNRSDPKIGRGNPALPPCPGDDLAFNLLRPEVKLGGSRQISPIPEGIHGRVSTRRAESRPDV